MTFFDMLSWFVDLYNLAIYPSILFVYASNLYNTIYIYIYTYMILYVLCSNISIYRSLINAPWVSRFTPDPPSLSSTWVVLICMCSPAYHVVGFPFWRCCFFLVGGFEENVSSCHPQPLRSSSLEFMGRFVCGKANILTSLPSSRMSSCWYWGEVLQVRHDFLEF